MNHIFKTTRYIALILMSSISVMFISCKKFLDQKPKLSQIVPHTASDLQVLLDNSSVINQSSAAGYAEYAADNYYVNSSDLQLYISIPDWYDGYRWGNIGRGIIGFWQPAYTGSIYYSNVVLDELPKISHEAKDSGIVKALKGSALFYRAFAFYNLAQVFSRPYDKQYLSSPGIVLRLTSDASVVDHHRATVEETYTKIIADLKEAASLLPINTSLPTRPCQAAAYAALARVYLSMRDYSNAGAYANLALQQKNTLLDYNTQNPSIDPPIAYPNPEVIFFDISANPPDLLTRSFARIDSVLYQSYDANDLRKPLFFHTYNGKEFYFLGAYSPNIPNTNGGNNVFDGLTTDELYLIRAECSARGGNKDSSMNDLNRVLKMRWKNTVVYSFLTATDANDALAKVLVERRKELVYRGQRWMDVRRLNLEGSNITPKRIVDGMQYTLPPNDLRTVMLIPDNEIAKSGIEQNLR